MIITPPQWFQAAWIAVTPYYIPDDFLAFVLWWTLEIAVIVGVIVWLG